MESKSRVFLDDWRCSSCLPWQDCWSMVSPQQKKASSETFAATVPNWDVSRKPEGWPRVDLQNCCVPRLRGGMPRSCMKFSQVTWCARRKRSGWVVRRFWGWWRGGLYSFCRFGQKLDVISHQQSLFVGRKLKHWSFNARQRWLF